MTSPAAADTPNVDPQPAALAQECDGFRNVPADPKVKGQVVSRTGWNDPKSCRASHHSPHNAVYRAVTAGHDDQLDTCLNCAVYHRFKLAVRKHRKDLRQDILFLHLGKDTGKLSWRIFRPSGIRIEDKFCADRAMSAYPGSAWHLRLPSCGSPVCMAALRLHDDVH